MNTRTVEIVVGIFMLLGLGALVVLAANASNLTSFGGKPGYQVSAYFENIGGLRVRAPVRISGVRIGHVVSIGYSDEFQQAHVVLHVDNDYRTLPIDTSAAVYTSGMIGEQYISLQPGAEDEYMQDGDTIDVTQSAVVLERLIGQFLLNQSSDK